MTNAILPTISRKLIIFLFWQVGCISRCVGSVAVLRCGRRWRCSKENGRTRYASVPRCMLSRRIGVEKSSQIWWIDHFRVSVSHLPHEPSCYFYRIISLSAWKSVSQCYPTWLEFIAWYVLKLKFFCPFRLIQLVGMLRIVYEKLDSAIGLRPIDVLFRLESISGQNVTLFVEFL